MPHYEFISHACKKSFSKILRLVDYEEREVRCSHCGSHKVERGNGGFQRARVYRVDALPAWIAAGDFNGDGIPDLVTANGGNTVSILLGNGDGTFQAHVNYDVGVNPQQVKVADLNGDSKLDLAVGNGFGKSVSVLLGNGDGSFQSFTSVPLSKRVVSMDLGDLNLDGKMDIVVLEAWSAGSFGTVQVLLGNGDGTFHSGATFQGSNGYALAAGDLNRDGKLDIVVLANGAMVFMGRGDGTFRPAVTYLSGFAYDIAIADLNGDGIPDLFTDGSGFNILNGNGDGTFQPPQTFLTGTGFPTAFADFNQDGKLDLATPIALSAISVILQASGNEQTIPSRIGRSHSAYNKEKARSEARGYRVN